MSIWVLSFISAIKLSLTATTSVLDIYQTKLTGNITE